MQKLIPYLTFILFLGLCVVSCTTEPLQSPNDNRVIKTKINNW